LSSGPEKVAKPGKRDAELHLVFQGKGHRVVRGFEGQGKHFRREKGQKKLNNKE